MATSGYFIPDCLLFCQLEFAAKLDSDMVVELTGIAGRSVGRRGEQESKGSERYLRLLGLTGLFCRC